MLPFAREGQHRSLTMIETTEIEIGDWVEVWNPQGQHCLVWGWVREDPDGDAHEDHTVVEVSASFDPKFPVTRRVRFPTECVFRMTVN